jgi:hypothetical protein
MQFQECLGGDARDRRLQIYTVCEDYLLFGNIEEFSLWTPTVLRCAYSVSHPENIHSEMSESTIVIAQFGDFFFVHQYFCLGLFRGGGGALLSMCVAQQHKP